MDIFPDTSFIIPLIIETGTTQKARDFYTSAPGSCAACMSVYEETFFVGLRLIARDEFGISGTAMISHLNDLFSGPVIVPDSTNLKLIGEIARTFQVLPGLGVLQGFLSF